MRSMVVVTLIWLFAGSSASAQVPPKLDTPEFFRDLISRPRA